MSSHALQNAQRRGSLCARPVEGGQEAAASAAPPGLLAFSSGFGPTIAEEEDVDPALALLTANLPAIRSAQTVPEKVELFLRKLEQCCTRVDFLGGESHALFQAKEMKRRILNELTIAICTESACLTSEVSSAICSMVAANAFRDIPAPASPNAPEFDPEEDDPMLVPEWEHLRLVYELFLKFLESSAAARPETPKLYVTEAFVKKILMLFYNEDPRERNMLKGILHKIYGNFVCLRRRIRKTIEYIFCGVIYDRKGKCNGVADLLQILGSIINGFALPLKDEHVTFLTKVLIPLHSSTHFNSFHDELKYCTVQYVEKDGGLAWPVIKGLLKYWSKSNSMKQVHFLFELEEILDIISDRQFELALHAVFKCIIKCISSQHFQVAERALAMFNNGIFFNLVKQNKATIFPVLAPVLNRCVTQKAYWNSTILEIAKHLRQKLRQIDADVFDNALTENKRKRKERQESRDDREFKWRKLAELALQNPTAAAAEGEADDFEGGAHMPSTARLKRQSSGTSLDGFEGGTEEGDMATSLQDGQLPTPQPLLVRRKSLLPRNSLVQAKLASFASEAHDGDAPSEPLADEAPADGKADAGDPLLSSDEAGGGMATDKDSA